MNYKYHHDKKIRTKRNRLWELSLVHFGLQSIDLTVKKLIGIKPHHEVWRYAVCQILKQVAELATLWKCTSEVYPPASLLLLWYNSERVINSGYYDGNGLWTNDMGEEIPAPNQWLLIKTV